MITSVVAKVARVEPSAGSRCVGIFAGRTGRALVLQAVELRPSAKAAKLLACCGSQPKRGGETGPADLSCRHRCRVRGVEDLGQHPAPEASTACAWRTPTKRRSSGCARLA